MRPKTTHELVEGSERPPRKGDRIELLLPRLGAHLRGTLFHVDELQILVKWDNGRSESLRPRIADRFRIIDEHTWLDATHPVVRRHPRDAGTVVVTRGG